MIATVVRSHVVRGGRANWRSADAGIAVPETAVLMPTASPAAAWPRADPLMCRVLGEVYPVASASADEERRPPAPDCWVSSPCRGRAATPSPPTNRSGVRLSGDSVQGGPVDELLDVAVERPVLE